MHHKLPNSKQYTVDVETEVGETTILAHKRNTTMTLEHLASRNAEYSAEHELVPLKPRERLAPRRRNLSRIDPSFASAEMQNESSNPNAIDLRLIAEPSFISLATIPSKSKSQ